MPKFIPTVVIVISMALSISPAAVHSEEPPEPLPQSVAPCRQACSNSEGCCRCGECRGATGCHSGSYCGCCEMGQHRPYFPELHGYYYFRPYNASQLSTQQAFATGWGGDPGNPYDNAIFQQVYAEYKAAAKVPPARRSPQNAR